jgi:hypothetical protein
MEPSKALFFIRIASSMIFGVTFSGAVPEYLFASTVYFSIEMMLFFIIGILSFLMIKTFKFDWYRAWSMPCSIGILLGLLFASVRNYSLCTHCIVYLLMILMMGYGVGFVLNKNVRHKVFRKNKPA